MNIWTYSDAIAGSCAVSDVGTPKPQEPQPEPPQPSVEDLIDQVPARVLKRHVMKAYHDLGGVDYLKRMAQAEPKEFNKLLAKILPQTVEADVRHELAGTQSLAVNEIPTHVLEKIVRQGINTIEGEFVEVTPMAAQPGK